MIEQILTQITNEYSMLFYIRQLLTILVLFTYGYFICSMLIPKKLDIYKALLAFPAGVSVFGILGLLILISGIKYCALTVIIAMAVFMFITALLKKDTLKSAGISKTTFIIFAAALVVAMISVSGVISTGFTNDSMYYYSEYPRAIVSRGGLYYGFDMRLTDAGQTTVVLNTLPYLFGFDETFGIHAFFNINFIAFFAYAVYEQAYKLYERKKSLIFAAVFTLLLITSMPFVLISKWNIANVYFMEQMFICMYIFFKASELQGSECDKNPKSDTKEIDITSLQTLLLMMLSFMRIEGSVYVILILTCALTLKNVKKRSIVVPAAAVLIFQALYFIKIFVLMPLYASYTFMTGKKACVIVALFILFIIYALFADKGKIIYNKLNREIVYLLALIIANIAVFAFNRASYIENIKSLITNMIRNGGWGFFPAVIIALVILVPKVRIKTLYFDMFFVCFALVSIIACALRGGTLRVSFADSGNRVFLQIVPFIIYAFAYRFIVSFKILENADKVNPDGYNTGK